MNITGEGKKVNVGIVGIGAIGRLHAENYAANIPNARLAAIADINLEAARTLSSSLGVTKTYADYMELLKDRSIDAVVLATPPFLKKQFTLAAAEHGKHVFCEKPMTLSMEDADEMVKAVERSKITFQVGYQRRFDPSFVRAKESIDRGEIGKILLVNARNRDPPTTIGGWSADPKKSGGIFLDTTSHDLDVVRWLTGSEVTSVYAEGNAMMYEELRKNGDYDTVVVSLKFANGAIGYVDSCSSTPYGFDSRAEVVGTEAGIVIDMGMRNNMRILKKDTVSNESHDSWSSRWAQAYRDEMVDFARCILEGRRPRATVQDGRAALRLGLAAWDSIRRDGPVSLS
jgi:myo-inositol 2-dehydrogenase / D-chiro-inositol 1-dehydrogenase